MRSTIFFVLLCVLCATVANPARAQLKQAVFADPPAAYRPSPFWSWNSALDDDELRRQVRDFKARGYGGYFMHARVGLVTRYLSDEWFGKVRTCLEEGRKQGLESWLYDEDKWPSGFAGGLATYNHPEFGAQGMGYKAIPPEEVAAARSAANTLGVFEGAGERLWFYTRPFRKLNWYNGEAYLDTLNPKAVARFLDLTFEQGYSRQFRKDFGPAMPGVFTDEPNYNAGGRDQTLFPWTAAFPEIFRARRGYDLLEKLPLLVRNLAGYQKVRYDFWRTAAELFEEAYSKPYGELCERLGLKLTGHYLAEDTMRSQTGVTGSVMLNYLHQQIPGIDHLRRNIDDPLTLKQVSSVAHQFNRQRVLCEIYGVSGHTASFEDLKWIADFHFALGINFLCPHLTLYAMAGDRKRDYPPTFSYHQPYWEDMKVLNDYLGRAAYFAASGVAQKDILLLHPLGSAWSEFVPGQTQEKVAQLDKALSATLKALLSTHRDFDLGDEIILERFGGVDNGMLTVGPGGRYQVVVVPPATQWTEATLALLEKFAVAGGRIIFRGEQPAGIQKLLLRSGVTRIGEDNAELERALDLAHRRDLSVTGADGSQIADIYYQHTVEGMRHLYFLTNTSRERSYHARIRIGVDGLIEEWDLATGQVRELRNLERDFPPAGSFAFTVDTAASPEPMQMPPRSLEERSEPLHGPFQFRRLQPNTLVLDRCRYSLGDGQMEGPVPVWRVRRAAFNAAGLQAYAGLQPWALEWKGIKPDKSAPVKMLFEFQSEVALPKAWLVVEKAENFTILFNGEKAGPADGWHWDRQFGRIPVAVRRGTNTVELAAEYRPGVEIEDIFLIGDFATKKVSATEYGVTSEPATLAAGDWVPQGYHFYAGNMTYQFPVVRRRGERILLRLKQPAGTLFRVRANGRDVSALGWQPWETDLTRSLRLGQNTVEVVVESSLQNSFGPLHNDHYKTDGHNWWFGPESFTDEKHWMDEYYHAPYGLLGGVEIVRMTAAR